MSHGRGASVLFVSEGWPFGRMPSKRRGGKRHRRSRLNNHSGTLRIAHMI